MKTKDEVFSWFQEFKALVENQRGRNIKVLRSNNGGEYTSSSFKELCVDSRIKRELIVSYNLQQNGVSKRKIGSIVGATKAMLHDHEFPIFLWVEACNTSVYLHNKSAHKVSGRMTPKEAFTGKRQEVGHIRIFRCLVYCHVLEERRTNLEPTVENGVLVSYNETSNVKFGSIDSHSPMRGHMGHPEASQGDLDNQPVLLGVDKS
jgi:transposase InsO family protein